MIRELPNENLPILLGLIFSRSQSSVDHFLDPSVDQAGDLGSFSHSKFGLGGDGGEMNHGDFTGLDGVVDLVETRCPSRFDDKQRREDGRRKREWEETKGK